MHLAAQPGPQRDELGAMTHQLPELPRRRRCDPRFGQASHPQQVREMRGVATVVLDPLMLIHPHTQRVREADVRAGVLESVDEPIPAIGGFDRDLRIRARLRDLERDRDRIVVQVHRTDDLAGFVHPHDRAATTMQINPDVLSLHRGLLKLVSRYEHEWRTTRARRERRPRSFMASSVSTF